MRTLPKFMSLLLSFIMTASLQAAISNSPADNEARNSAYMGSTYVPTESWIYAAFDRLITAGYAQTAFVGLRPWTRLDCARLVEEAGDLVPADASDHTAEVLLRSLRTEFARELRRRDGARNREARLESFYLRSSTIAGQPLTDGFHFAETLVNQSGRPFGEGANLYTGASVRATAGPFAAYIHAEIQRVPSAPVTPGSAAQSIAAADFTPVAAAPPVSGFTYGRLLEANVSFTLRNNQFTFGRQSLWWGPGRSGPTLFSTNAEPIDMLRYDRVEPFTIPGPLRLLGPIRIQLLAGRLSGHQFTHASNTTFGTAGMALRNQPLIHAEKVSFHPTPNFEFSVSRSTILGGTGSPITARSVLRSYFSASTAAEQGDPGDRRVAVDAQYRLPGLRRCAAVYVDTFADDEPFPVTYPTESSWQPGVFLTCVPHLPHLTLRAEGLLTPHRDVLPGFFYFNVHYLSGYTNNHQLIGSWIGREGQGAQAWATWWISPRSFIEANVRTMNVSPEFLRGGTLRDFAASANLALTSEWQLRIDAQAERTRFPLLSDGVRHNVTATVQITYRPLAREN